MPMHSLASICSVGYVYYYTLIYVHIECRWSDFILTCLVRIIFVLLRHLIAFRFSHLILIQDLIRCLNLILRSTFVLNFACFELECYFESTSLGSNDHQANLKTRLYQAWYSPVLFICLQYSFCFRFSPVSYISVFTGAKPETEQYNV